MRSGTAVTERVYRHQLRPVIQTGAVTMNRLFEDEEQGTVQEEQDGEG